MYGSQKSRKTVWNSTIWIFSNKSVIFSFHYVNSHATLKDMKEVQDNEYSHCMGDAMGSRNWDMFAKLKYP